MERKPEDVISDPYVLEFLGLAPNDDFYQSHLEQALIIHLQKFLLELGRGYRKLVRQGKRTSTGGKKNKFCIRVVQNLWNLYFVRKGMHVRTVLVLYKYCPYFCDFVGIRFDLLLMWKLFAY